MGLMDMLSPFATGFLEKRVEQQDAREKYIEDQNKLKDSTLAEISKNKQKLIDEKNIGIHFDEVQRRKEEELLIGMYENSMNPIVFKWLKDNKYFYSNAKWEGFSNAFKENAGGSDLWYKTKVVGSNKTWEQHMADQLQQPLTNDEKKDGAKEGIDLGPNSTQFMLEITDQPFSLLDARSINPVKFQEYRKSTLDIKKTEADVTIAQWDAENKETIGNLDIESKNINNQLNNLIIKSKQYDLETQPAKDKIFLLNQSADLLTKQINNSSLRQKNTLIINDLQVGISQIEQNMGIVAANKDLNYQKLKLTVENLGLENQMQDVMLSDQPAINAARIHGMQLSNIEQEIKNKTVGEHEKEILNNIKMRNTILEKDIDNYDKETKLKFEKEQKLIEKLEKEINEIKVPTFLTPSARRNEIEESIGNALGVPKEQGQFGLMTFNYQVFNSPWIETVAGQATELAIEEIINYNTLIQNDSDYAAIDPKNINMGNISNRILGEKFNTKYNLDLSKAYTSSINQFKEDNNRNPGTEEKQEIQNALENIMEGVSIVESNKTLSKYGITDLHFFETRDGTSNASPYNNQMIELIDRYRKDEFNKSKDIIKLSQ